MYIISRSDIIKVVAAPLFACILFVAALFILVLPISKNNLLEQKKETISFLTQTAIDILAYYEDLASSGKLSEPTAMEQAAGQIRALRYGPDGKDYFWINDMFPRMIMHPYRSDLEGQDLSNYTDPNGKRLFIEFVGKVRQEGSGYVPYHWQWKDAPDHIAAKLSYVKLFEPWGWVVGTGVYLDEVHEQFAKIARKLIIISGAIFVVIVLLSLVVIYQGLSETSKRRGAEQELKRYYENLEHLVDQRTAELQKALSEVRLLSGMLPICASCKKIRDDKGYWNQIESYIQQHSNAEFSHSICPDCMKKLYPKYSDKLANKNE